MPELVRPSVEYAESYAEAIKEFQVEGRFQDVDIAEIETQIIYEYNKIHTQDPNRVPSKVFWLVEGQRFLARGSIRPLLNEFFIEFGGNIGYEVRPSERKKGYGSLILALMLPEAKRMGMQKLLVCCDTDNHASIRIIQKNGGIKRDTHMVSWHPKPFYRWWIHLNDSQAE